MAFGVDLNRQLAPDFCSLSDLLMMKADYHFVQSFWYIEVYAYYAGFSLDPSDMGG